MKKMKYKNVSNELKNFKLNGEWVGVQPGELVDLPVDADKREHGLERVMEGQEGVLKSKVEEGSGKLSKSKKMSGKASESPVEHKSKEELKKMTKDQLNDYAANMGLEKVSQRMRKDVMVRKILGYLKKLLKG